MKTYPSLIIGFIMLSAGCVLAPCWAAVPVQAPADVPSPQTVLTADAGGPLAQPSKLPSAAVTDEYKDEYKDEYDDESFKEERLTIADPLEPFNRGMYHFNDKLYFWLVKPVAQGYKAVVPEPARVSVKNFFSNLGFPARFVSCLLQADFSGAATEAGRFTINTLWGIGGLMDPSAGKELDLQKQNTDLGQTLGVYGVGHGFYIVWPFWGPSSPRDSVTIAGDYFLYPPSYITPWYASSGVIAYEALNNTSLRIGEYESLKGAAIDPYVSMRDAYIQYRMKDVKARQARSVLFKNSEAGHPAADAPQPKNNPE
ncbi:MAG: VacJ family lipoprotein [Deltaproteobacteria bacterium HGW-Deltaproteobacteria-6]|jgi:phospholipid-binding lipoprotein MlaA|nr:MAG: VacJ family lipoprotein [Deltaproteobacteria bacterium HGW-Deltaproteobacteria-6]